MEGGCNPSFGRALLSFGVALVLAAALVACSGGGDGATAARITTIVGTGEAGTAGEGGPATEAQLTTPIDLAFDRDGNMFVVERYGSRVVRVDADGLVTVIASGLTGASAVATDTSGNVYVADAGANRIQRIDHDGRAETIAGTGEAGFSGDGGPATAARINDPGGMAFGRDGMLYFADLGNLRIRAVDPQGTIATVLGTGFWDPSPDGTRATEATLGLHADHFPLGLELDGEGRIYFTDHGHNQVRLIDAGGVVRDVAGNGDRATDGDGGSARDASLYEPLDIALGPDGRLFVTTHDHGGGTSQRIRVVDAEGTIETVAGTGATGFLGDGGAAVEAAFDIPSGIDFGPDGNLYVADARNNVVRMVELVG